MQKPSIHWNAETGCWDTTDCYGHVWPMRLWYNAWKIIEIDYRDSEVREAARTQNWSKP